LRDDDFVGEPHDYPLGECVDEERETVVVPVIPMGKKIPNNTVCYTPTPEEFRHVDRNA